MPVDQASYRAWEGTARPGRRAALAIAGTMIRNLRRSRMVKALVVAIPLLMGGFAVTMFSFSYLLEGISPLESILSQVGLRPSDVNLLAFMNRLGMGVVGTPAILLAALVGAPLIAEDRRSRALPLYFSRPVRHFDYVAGKFLAVAFFLSLLLVLPPILIYLVEVGFSPKDGVALSQLPTLGWSLVPNLARLLVLGAVALAASALTKRTSHAVLLFFGIMLVAYLLGQTLSRQVFDDPSWRALSPGSCVERLGVEYLPLPRPLERASWSLREMGVGTAWLGLGAWTAAALAVIVARVRKVEVVT